MSILKSAVKLDETATVEELHVSADLLKLKYRWKEKEKEKKKKKQKEIERSWVEIEIEINNFYFRVETNFWIWKTYQH